MPVPDELVLRLSEVSLAYGRKRVLAGVDLTVLPGQRWFVLGRNGTGKTTLLRCVLRLLRPCAGTLEWGPEYASPRSVAYVPQGSEVNAALPVTVREFVSYGQVGLPGKSLAGDAVAWALHQVGLDQRGADSYWHLSGGQRQRAVLARALVRRPRLLILDEPTAGLDSAAEEAFLGLLEQQARTTALTLLYVTHSFATAMRHATHVALVSGGQVETGLPAELLRPARLARAFAETTHVA